MTTIPVISVLYTLWYSTLSLFQYDEFILVVMFVHCIVSFLCRTNAQMYMALSQEAVVSGVQLALQNIVDNSFALCKIQTR